VESGDYDVLHYHNVSLLGGPSVLRLGAGVKLYTAHEYWLICPTHVLFRFDREPCEKRTCWRCTLRSRRPPQLWRSGSLLRRSLEAVDCLVMSSRFSLEKHRQQGIDRPAVVLPPIVPTPDEEAGAAESERPYFVYAGRLEKLKGVADLVEVFTDFPAADLWIVGDGSEAPALERMASGSPNIRFLGAMPSHSLPAIYGQAVATLLPSVCYETFGLSAAESLSCGTPIVARDHGAMREMIETSGGGLLFSDQHGLREALSKCLREDRLRSEMGRKGQRFARQNWARDVHLRRYLSLVEGLRRNVEPAAVERRWVSSGRSDVKL